MTETAFPFPAQADNAVAPAEEVVASGDNRRKLLIGGAAVVVLLLIAGYFLFLRGGSSDESFKPVVRHHPSAAAAKAKAKVAKQTLPQTFNGTVGRDPFKPLVVPPPPAPSAAPGTTGGSTNPTTGSTGSSSTTGSTPVALQKVYQQGGKTYVQLTVSGAVYAPVVGQTFAETFKLLSAGGTTATLVQGDEQFSLRVGQVVLR